jgi:CDP-diacylglycerol--glycerol-3-phosphate 3-phosphatidyltransferase
VTLYQIKPRFQSWLRPLTGRLAKRGVTANQVTVAAAAGSLAVGALTAALVRLPIIFLLMPFWLFVRMALNAIDGMLAREHGQKSVLGAYLNELGDIVSDLALIVPFAWAMPSASGEVIVFAVLAVMVECAGLIGPLVGAGRRYDGPVGKSDRALALGALALCIGLGIGLGLDLGRYGPLVWVLLSVLSLLTIANRVRCGVKEAKQANEARADDPNQLTESRDTNPVDHEGWR